MVVTLSVDTTGIARLHGSFKGFIDALPKALSKDTEMLKTELAEAMIKEIQRPRPPSGTPLKWKERLLAASMIPQKRKEEGTGEMWTWHLPEYAEWLNSASRHWVPTFSTKGNLKYLKEWADEKRAAGGKVPRWIRTTPTFWLNTAMAMAGIRIDERLTGGLNIDKLLKKLMRKGGT